VPHLSHCSVNGSYDSELHLGQFITFFHTASPCPESNRADTDAGLDDILRADMRGVVACVNEDHILVSELL